MIKEYLLTDATFRKTANDLGFICNIGNKRYKICPDQPGFCRTWYKNRFIIKDKKMVDYIPADNYQFLLDAGTRCFQKDKYPFYGIE